MKMNSLKTIHFYSYIIRMILKQENMVDQDTVTGCDLNSQMALH